MFQDIKVSEDLNSEFKDTTRNNNEHIAGRSNTIRLSASIMYKTQQRIAA